MSGNGNGHHPAARLRRLEVIWQAPPCATCHGSPTRVMIHIPGTAPSDNLPGGRCPECERAPRQTVHIIGDEEDTPA
jgi:hypothetical protein